METALHTSAVELISSIHGNQRRVERAIEKKDLQSAVKYGTKELSMKKLKNGTTPERYKYTFADIVYITDKTSTREITSWVLPLPLNQVEISDIDQHQYEAAKFRISQDPKIITSHSVFVIDFSGSMRNSDVEAHRSRADAVSYAVASEFMAKRLHNPSSGVSQFDVVTVIEMRNDAQIIFSKEPMSWVFYNKFIARMKNSRPSYHGNYIPSLDLALRALNENDHENLALFLFFLSDGRPSDSCTSEEIYRRVGLIGSYFRNRLTFSMEGFGSPLDDLTVLEKMATNLKIYGAAGDFHRSNLKKVGSLSTSLANISSTLTKSCTLLTKTRKDARKERSFTISNFKKDIKTPPPNWEKRFVRQNRLHCIQMVRKTKMFGSEEYFRFIWEKRPLRHTAAVGITFSDNPFGEGAERLVYQLREIDAYGRFVGPELVAKDGRFEGDFYLLRNFHSTFCKTQMIAANMAEKFNQRLKMSPQVGEKVPRIKFLDCYVYCFYNQNYEFYYLVEKQLDNSQYKKWNDNRGGVHGQVRKPAFREEEDEVEREQLKALKMLKDLNLKTKVSETIIEENSEDEFSDEETSHPMPQTNNVGRPKNKLVIVNEEVPQAFSHFTYMWSKREKIVCDLQGVLDTSQKPPVFEFTDPVIHYKSKSGRKNVFGRTDKGQKGINDFFVTHKCNNVCKALGLSPDNL